jgi:hypothetical protein
LNTTLRPFFSEYSLAERAPEVPKSVFSLRMASVLGLPRAVAMSSRMAA